MPNGNGSPKGQRNARSNHEVLATEREPEGQAQSAQQSVCKNSAWQLYLPPLTGLEYLWMPIITGVALALNPCL